MGSGQAVFLLTPSLVLYFYVSVLRMSSFRQKGAAEVQGFSNRVGWRVVI